jgi:pimeloyl-ACP methyl ester carboxylesterase
MPELREATYMLVHGGGHGGWCWQRVAGIMRERGHEVYTPTLTGLGERSHLLSPRVSLDTHITDIENVLRYEDLNEVILVGHSYAGMVITGVADRALERVSQLVYLDAAMPLAGESVVDMSPALREMARADFKTVDGVQLILWPGSPLARSVYGVTNPADLAWMERKLTPHPWQTFEQPLTMRRPAQVRNIPRTIINCPSTLRKRSAAALARYFDADRVWEIDTGHDVMITEPKALAEMLLSLSG